MPGPKPPPSVATRHLRLSDLRAPISFDLRPDAPERAEIAARLGATAIAKLRLDGRIAPYDGGHILRARLGATVIQPCSVTLDTVTTRIDEDVVRQYLRVLDMPGPGTETEMPEDDSVEPAPDVLDLATVLEEALSLALPAFPRAPGAGLGEAVFAAPGIAPMTNEAASPFAVLKGRTPGHANPEDDTGGE
jgi:uncharacterized metal-binding protein YceD (DUF177 family)